MKKIGGERIEQVGPDDVANGEDLSGWKAKIKGAEFGDNVGDIAGMGSDLFGSLAESTCAALVVGATSPDLINTTDAMYFPLMITAAGILVSFVTQFFADPLLQTGIGCTHRILHTR